MMVFSVYIVIYNSLGRHIFLPGQRPDKKHRMFIRCEKRGKSMLISKLNAWFCPSFPAVLNRYNHFILFRIKCQ